MFFVVIFSLVLLVYPINSVSQTLEDDVRLDASDGIEPPDGVPVGPVGNTGAEYKFDDGFYQKIHDIALEEPRDGDPGVYDGVRYYDVVMVVSRDDGDDRDPDDVAMENKHAVVKRLELLGARDIVSAEILSFVTASIPVADVPGFSLHDEVYGLGDGAQPVTLEVDKARQTIRATDANIKSIAERSLTGTGVTVAVIDSGINHDSLNHKVLKSVFCDSDGCETTSTDSEHLTGPGSTHGTRVAQVLAASGLPNNNGIAPGVKLLDASIVSILGDVTIAYTFTTVAHALDWALKNGADIANMSFGMGSCTKVGTTSSLIVNEAVDKGMVVVAAAGNSGLNDMGTANPNDDIAVYQSIVAPSCAYNIITVGGINDRGTGPITMFNKSSRGPIPTLHILKPELVAPAYNINTLSYVANDTMHPRSGTSYATPQVSATAAIMLEYMPHITPVEVKSALLLGADWHGPIPCTSSQYETNTLNHNCSYAMQPRDINSANNATSLEILNNTGFGILDVKQTLEYLYLGNRIFDSYLDSETQSKQFTFRVMDTSDPVKVILTWFVHPHGGILEQATSTAKVPVANLDFNILSPNGTTIRANSDNQTNEFAVFNPPQTGTYTVTVSGTNLDAINKPVQNFVLASTHPLRPLSDLTSGPLPSATAQTVVINPDAVEPVKVVLNGSSDGGPISFYISDNPSYGTVSTVEFVTNTISNVLYTPNHTFDKKDKFNVIPRNILGNGPKVTINIVGENLPPSSTEADPDSSVAGDWDTFVVKSKSENPIYEQEFRGKNYPVSSLYVGSSNMNGVHLEITNTDGEKYTIAVPQDGARMIKFSPITIQSVKLSANGINEVVADKILDVTSEDVRMFVGYVPASCSAPAAQGTSASQQLCPAQIVYRTVTPKLEIPDGTGNQDTTSSVDISAGGTITSLSVSVDITHPYISDLVVKLVSPNGTTIKLHDRNGDMQSNIDTTYTSSSHTDLGGLVGSQLAGSWILSVGDYKLGDTGTLNGWTFDVAYNTTPETVFSDDFESSLDTNWDETGDGDWTTATSALHGVPTIPGHSSTNLVLHSDDCDNECTITLKNPINMTDYTSATLSFWRYVDVRLDNGEYLKVNLYDGSTWKTAYNWTNGNGDDSTWTKESCSLDSYTMSSGFKMRLVTKQSLSTEDVQVDDIVISSGTDNSTQSCIPSSADTAPVISSISDISLSHEQTMTVSVSVSDEEKDPVTFSLVSPPGFVTILGNTITIDPDSSDVGGHTITVKATANGKSDTEEFIVTVTETISCPKNYFVQNNMCDPGMVTVSGYVFRDTDRDGIKDTGERGINGITMKAFAGGNDNGVSVHNQVLKSATTNSTGFYTLSDIPTGSDYVLVQVIQDGTQIYTTTYYITIFGTVNSGTQTFNVGLR